MWLGTRLPESGDLVPRPFPPPVFDHLHCASDQRLKLGMAQNKARLTPYVAHSDSVIITIKRSDSAVLTLLCSSMHAETDDLQVSKNLMLVLD